MNGGYIRLYRKSQDSQVWQDANLWKVWSWCLLNAAYRETWVKVHTGRGCVEVKLKPGQLIFQRNKAANQLRLHPSTLRDLMAKLSKNPTTSRQPKLENIDIQPDNQYSVVTILNWERYQSSDKKK